MTRRARIARGTRAAAVCVAVAAGRAGAQEEVQPPNARIGQPPAADTVRRAALAEGERRFELVAVGDSTVTLIVPGERWVRGGLDGIAVDPRRRDALVARLRVIGRSADTVVALVTGQTTRMSTDFVALFRRPSTPPLRQRAFWGGWVAGLLMGAAAVGAALRWR